MSANVHAMLLRPRRFFFFTCFWLFLLVGLATMPRKAATQIDAFLVWGLFLPFAFGATFAEMIHEPMHRSFSLLLPGGTRRLIRSHGVVVVIGAVVCGLFGYMFDHNLPPIALASVAAAALSLALPFEPGWRWAGSRSASCVIIALALGTLGFPGRVKEFLIGNPYTAAAIALGFAATSFGVAFSKARRRVRAMNPHTSYFSAFMAPELTAQRAREDLARSKASRAQWSPRASARTVVAWVRVVAHERYGRLSMGLVTSMLASVAALIVLGGFLHRGAGGLAQGVYELVFASGQPGAMRDFPFFLALLVVAHGICLPRADFLYPISRHKRAQVAFAGSAWQLGTAFSLLTGGTVLAAWIASRWLDLAFELRTAAQFAMILAFTLPLFPLMQWGAWHKEVRNDQTMMVLCGLITFGVAVVWHISVRSSAIDLVSVQSLAWCIALITVSQWTYFAALNRFYRAGDLLQRGVKRQNFSLV